MAGMKLRLVLFTAALIAIFWANALLEIRERRASAIREAERETSTLALTLEEQVHNSISAADLTLRLVVRMAEEGNWANANDAELAGQGYLKQMAAEIPQINNLAIVSRDGAIVAQSIGPITGMTAVDREYYTVHRDAPDIGTHISPAVRGRASGRNVVTVSRAIVAKDGSFAGVAVAAMNPNYFHKTYTALDLGLEGAIALFDIRGAVINRQPNPGNVIGESAAHFPLFTEHLLRAPIGSFTSKSPFDGTVRIVSYRHIAATPFIVLVGKSQAETLEPWRWELRRATLALGIISLLLMFGCMLILRETASRQKSLEASEHRFRSTFDHAPVGIAQLDLEGRWLLTNSALCQILGYSEAELRETSFADLTHPDDRGASRAAWDAMVRGELSLCSSEKRYLRKNGQAIWVSLTASLQSGADRGKPYVLSILADITSRKSAEADLLAKSEQLRQSEETSRKQALILQSIIASMADAVIVADEQRRIVLFNPAARALFGEPPVGSVNPDDCPRQFGLYRADGQTLLSPEEVPLGRALLGDSIDSAEIYVRNATMVDGAYISVSSRPMLDDAGIIRGAVVVCRDITEARLTGEALRQAQKMEAVGQLTGGIAHDFNNLLQVIMGNSEILAEVLKNSRPQQKLAQMTLTAAQRGAELTSQLLSFSRRQALQPRPTDVRRLVAETEALLSGAIGAAIEFKQEFPPDLWQVVVDPGMLQNALVNLVLNARDSMPNGGRITIQVENFVCDDAYASRQKDVRPGDYVRINVADTGVGIPPANLEKVFEPFFTTKEVGKGSGLGLSMVYGFIQQSGGAIHIRSAEGYGTVVQLYLPRAVATSRQPAAHANAVPQGSETILVVEDDPPVRDFVVAALRSLGYAVLATADSQTALQCLKAYDGVVHLLFSDIVMPGGMTGWELAKHAIVLRPSLKVLLTSGYADAVSGRSHSKTDYPLLLKPYSKAELATAIRAALGSEQARMAS